MGRPSRLGARSALAAAAFATAEGRWAFPFERYEPLALRVSSSTVSFEPPIDFALAESLARAHKVTLSLGLVCACLPWLFAEQAALAPTVTALAPAFALLWFTRLAERYEART